MAKKALASLEEKIDGRIVVEGLSANPFKAVVLKDVAILDNNPWRDSTGFVACDTLFRAKYITASFGLGNLLGAGGLKISTAKITGAMMYLSIEPGTRPDVTTPATPADQAAPANNNNLKRIFRLKKRTEKKEKSDKDIFSIGSVKIEDMSFVMENFTKDKSKFEGGINWFDMKVTDINISGRNLKMKGPVMSGKCDSLSFREKSGYGCRKSRSRKRQDGSHRLQAPRPVVRH